MRRGDTGLDILQGIVRDGWTEELASSFEMSFGEDIRRLLVLYLWRLGLVEYRFDPTRASAILTNRREELYENTLTDIWLELIRGLVAKYVKGYDTGKIKQAFRAYLAGVIRHMLIKNAQDLSLLPKESPAELLRALCGAKKESTKAQHIARIKFVLWNQVKQGVLSACSRETFKDIYKELQHVLDYFFEVFLPQNCVLITGNKAPKSLSDLISYFGKRELGRAKEYIGTITPYSPNLRYVYVSSEDTAAEETLFDMIASRGTR